ncbi:efflux RND transporter periplasmic adaptor subunit [Chlamydiota bacterium]
MSRNKKSKLIFFILIIAIGIGIMYGQMKFRIITKSVKKITALIPSRKEPVKEKEKKPEQEQQEPVPVKVVKIKKGDFQDNLPVLGTIQGLTEVKLKFEVNGIIDAFNFKEGERVNKGEVVSRLNNKDSLLKVKYRKAKYEVAKQQHEGALKKVKIYKDLFRVGAIIRDKLEEAEIEAKTKEKEMEATRIEIESSKQELSKTYLKSPITGIIGQLEIEPGEFVTSNDDIVSVLDIIDVNIEIGITEKDINKIEIGQPVKIYVDTYPDKEFTGAIESITPVIKGKSRTLTIKAKVANDEGFLVPGMFAKGRITVFEKSDAITVPISAVEGTGDEKSVFVVSEDNTVDKRDVTVGYIATDTILIDSGLNPGDIVVTDTPVQLKKGAAVKITETEEVSGEAPKGVGAEVAEKS